jgi:peptidoglycan hydrolase-like protein with peptidoglycan-binding domain
MRGTDVSSLQTFLSQDVNVYPSKLVTGYFGSLTKSAVSIFQTNNNISSVGRVGPQTLPVINEQIVNGMRNTTDIIAPEIYNTTASVSSRYANISWNTNQNAKGMIYYSNTPLVLNEKINSVDVSGMTAMTNMSYVTGQNVLIQNLQPNTDYFYLVYVTDESGNVSVTWPGVLRTTN